jgi:hypothetical protein
LIIKYLDRVRQRYKFTWMLKPVLSKQLLVNLMENYTTEINNRASIYNKKKYN